jgi:periodic tryptophan protein 1
LENGVVLSFDTRALPSDLSVPSPSLFTLQAHNGACSALDVNPHIRGCIATGGTDKRVKVWNIIGGEEGGMKNRDVSLVTSRDLSVVSSSLHLFLCYCSLMCFWMPQGKVFSTLFSPDDPLTLAAAGSSAKLQVWDVGANMGVKKAFATKLREVGKVLKEKESTREGVVGVASDDEDTDDES